MTVAELVLRYVDVLIWPVVVFLLVGWRFKEQIREAVGRLSRVKALGAEADFSAGLAKSEELSAETTAKLPGEANRGGIPVEPPEATRRNLSDLRLASGDPTFSVLSAWESLRMAVEELAETAVPYVQGSAWSVLLHELTRRGVTNREFTTSVMELQRLRNQIAHGRYEPTEGQALTYVATARELQRAADVLRRTPPPSP